MREVMIWIKLYGSRFRLEHQMIGEIFKRSAEEHLCTDVNTDLVSYYFTFFSKNQFWVSRLSFFKGWAEKKRMDGGVDSSRSLWFSIRILLRGVSSYEAQLNLCLWTLQLSISIHSQPRHAFHFLLKLMLCWTFHVFAIRGWNRHLDGGVNTNLGKVSVALCVITKGRFLK